jgi:muramoyltetrapeptide carboxypeptidase LdcA involved in peptidoglycan recycling
LDGVKAIVLGNFQNCNDVVGKVLAAAPSEAERARMLSEPRPEELSPLRKRMEGMRSILDTFSEASKALKIPVYHGLPIGHGPGIAPLPLGATYRLSSDGKLELLRWEWLSS